MNNQTHEQIDRAGAEYAIQPCGGGWDYCNRKCGEKMCYTTETEAQ